MPTTRSPTKPRPSPPTGGAPTRAPATSPATWPSSSPPCSPRSRSPSRSTPPCAPCSAAAAGDLLLPVAAAPTKRTIATPPARTTRRSRPWRPRPRRRRPWCTRRRGPSWRAPRRSAPSAWPSSSTGTPCASCRLADTASTRAASSGGSPAGAAHHAQPAARRLPRHPPSPETELPRPRPPYLLQFEGQRLLLSANCMRSGAGILF
uniref:Uncharacterized protein n=1 Tax=Arundo donax TaxID=35708 RepID=A0A0A9DM59_ARUDO